MSGVLMSSAASAFHAELTATDNAVKFVWGLKREVQERPRKHKSAPESD